MPPQSEDYFRKDPRGESFTTVRDIDLGQHRAGARVQRQRGADHGSFQRLLSKHNRGGCPLFHEWRILLRDIDVEPQGGEVHDRKQRHRLGRRTRRRLNQRAGVRKPARQDAIVRRADFRVIEPCLPLLQQMPLATSTSCYGSPT